MGIELSNDVALTIPGYPGVVVNASKPETMRQFFLMKRFARLGEIDEDNLDDVDVALVEFGDTFLVSWNVDRRGQPVEPNGAGLAQLPATFQFALLTEWIKAVRGVEEVAAPLGQPSPDGRASAEPQTTEPASG